MAQLERENRHHQWHARSTRPYGRRKEHTPFHGTDPTTGFKSIITPEAAKHLERYDAEAISREAKILTDNGLHHSLDTISFQKLRDLDSVLVDAVAAYINLHITSKSSPKVDSSDISYREFYTGLMACGRIIFDQKSGFQNLSELLKNGNLPK